VVVEGVLMVVVFAMEAGTVVATMAVALPLDIATLIAHAIKFVSV
jgi:hypothetical protein